MEDDEDLRDLQRPEGRLLEIALLTDGRSARKFAPTVGLSDARLRQIIKGYQSVGGQAVAVTAPASTLARIAVGLNVPPGRMSEASRPDAADLMYALYDQADQDAAALVSPLPDDASYVAAPGDRSEDEPVSPRELRDELRAIRAVLERLAERNEPRS